ncbi:MAG: aminopeptidase [Actinomycetota bacterium]|nr:aminopeptidase [Actinomycetota bacterium]
MTDAEAPVPPSRPDLAPAARAVLDDCLRVRPGEELLVVTDPGTRSIGEVLVAGGRARGAEAVLVEIAERESNGTEPPPSVAAAMASCDVLIAPTTKSLSHTEARRAANAAGARAATMPGITEEMMARTMAADFSALRPRSREVARLLTEGSEVRITSAAGTDLTLGIEGRTGLSDDGDLSSSGAFGNLPPGEAFLAPVEGTTNGRLVIDGTMWPVGRLAEPLVFEVSGGYVRAMTGRHADEVRAAVERHGPEAFAIAELGIGTNDAAQLTGNVLEDEKILGTIHVAIGDNHTFGGTIRVSSHQDGIVLDPTLSIDGHTILDAGKLLV